MSFNREQVATEFKEMIGLLCETFGPSGFEEEVVELVKKYVKDLKVEVTEDAFHNLIVHRKGNGKTKVFVSAHLDEIGMIIRHIDAKGFIWFEPLGGIAAQQFFGKQVVIKTDEGKHINGVVNSMKPGRPEKCTEMPSGASEFFIEVGAETREEVLEMGIEEGNAITFAYPTLFLGNHRVAAKALDDRACLFMLIQLLKALEDEEDLPDLYAVFSVQEEVGARGAIVAATQIKPDIAIALDMSLACDVPGFPERKYVNELGKGASIKVMDKLSTGIVGVICDKDIVRDMKAAAKEAGLNYQIEAYSAGATDASLIQTLNGGIRCGGIQIPMRYVHSYEVCDIRDVLDSIELLYRYVKKVS